MSLALGLAKTGMRLLYLLFRPLPIQNKVVMLSRESDSDPIDFVLIRQRLKQVSPETEVVSFCRKMTRDINPVSYCLFLMKSLYHIATASVAVTDTYSIPLCVLRHKKGQTVIQIWHAVGAVKQFSYQCLDRPGGRTSAVAKQMAMHRNYDYIVCTSEATRRIYAQAFDTPAEKILPIGMPRVDYIRQPQPELREKYLKSRPDLKGKLLALYLPTFRDGLEEGVQAMVAADRTVEEVAVLVKPHPLTKMELPRTNCTEPHWSTYDLMKVCDVVITDYSAASLETSLLNKPVYFYLFDKDSYVREQGLNIDPEQELPLASFRNAEQLLRSVALGGYDMGRLEAFRERYITTAEEDNTGAVTELICAHLPQKEAEQPVGNTTEI